MQIFRLFLSFILLVSFGIGHADVAEYFQQIKQDPDRLYQFLKAMPKGGDLHYHLAGGAYPQVMLELARQDHHLCLDLHSSSVKPQQQTCERPSTGIARTNIYHQFLKAWSMIGFKSKQVRSRHDHFFGAFFKFMPVVSQYRAELLNDVIARAAEQHEQYLEVMILPDNAASTLFAPHALNWRNLEKDRQRLLNNPDFQNNITHTMNQANQILIQSREKRHCHQNNARPECQVFVRFQYYVLREQSIEKVFAQALNAFEVANRKGPFVGVNLVQPEDGVISMRDYRKQMTVFQYMHQVYPGVHISLHAGELSNKLVPSAGLTTHIYDAIKIGHAERIGHGVDILHETEATRIFRAMQVNEIAVEVNLTSNATILGIGKDKHPLRHYLKHHVPVVLSTDDEGILQTNLSQQYWIAANEFNLDYTTIKQINRNALTYSFLPGTSIWQNAHRAELVKACEDLNSHLCQQFVAQNAKAAQQRLLELSLIAFEESY